MNIEVVKEKLLKILDIDIEIYKIHSEKSELEKELIDSEKEDKNCDTYHTQRKIQLFNNNIETQNNLKRDLVDIILNEIIDQDIKTEVDLKDKGKYIIRRSGYLYDGKKADIEYFKCMN